MYTGVALHVHSIVFICMLECVYLYTQVCLRVQSSLFIFTLEYIYMYTRVRFCLYV